MAENTNNAISDRFFKYTGKSLAEEVEHNPQISGMTETAFIERTRLMLVEEIKLRCPSTDESKFNDREKEAINKAILEQMLYMLVSGDYSLIVGYDTSSNSLADLKELRKRQYSPLSLKILTNAGLMYSGIKTRYNRGQNFDPYDMKDGGYND